MLPDAEIGSLLMKFDEPKAVAERDRRTRGAPRRAGQRDRRRGVHRRALDVPSPRLNNFPRWWRSEPDNEMFRFSLAQALVAEGRGDEAVPH